MAKKKRAPKSTVAVEDDATVRDRAITAATLRQLLTTFLATKGLDALVTLLTSSDGAAERVLNQLFTEYRKSATPSPQATVPETLLPLGQTRVVTAPSLAGAQAITASPATVQGTANDAKVPPAVPPTPGSGGGSGPYRPTESDNLMFDPRNLDAGVIAIPLAEAMKEVDDGRLPTDVRYYGGVGPMGEANAKLVLFPVIIDLNLDYPGGRERARYRVFDLLTRILVLRPETQCALNDALPPRLRDSSPQYVFADLFPEEIRELARLDNGWKRHDPETKTPVALSARASTARPSTPAVFRIWPSHAVRAMLIKSVATIKGNAAAATFAASGRGIVWAIMDSGIDGAHRHFQTHRNLSDLPSGVSHQDFTDALQSAPLRDVYGHGTHVAGIVAGKFTAVIDPSPGTAAVAPAQMLTYVRDEQNHSSEQLSPVTAISGVAPECKLVSYKVLDDAGRSDDVRNIIAALEHVAKVNEYGLNIRIHGVNLSLGYPYDPRWFACGHSPLCQVIDRLIRSGVVVVAAAGNTGYIYEQTAMAGVWAQGASLSINDPGNADAAITVGSTHRDEPYRYGASYFSSKGPTGDGRTKPDLLAPGEKIVSCASYDWSKHTQRGDVRPSGMSTAPARPEYREDSGTSMAAPHVSGAVASFLSTRREFIGRPEVVKEIFLKSASDLGRERYLQGHGLIDLLRALQSV